MSLSAVEYFSAHAGQKSRIIHLCSNNALGSGERDAIVEKMRWVRFDWRGYQGRFAQILGCRCSRNAIANYHISSIMRWSSENLSLVNKGSFCSDWIALGFGMVLERIPP